MESVYALGSDIGGSSVKSMLFDLTAKKIIAIATKPLRLYHPEPDATTYVADEILAACVDGMKECLDSSGVDRTKVEAIVSDGQQAGLIWVDKDGNAISPFDTWMDNRYVPFAAVMNETCGDRILEKGGNNAIITTGPKILWWKKNDPEVYKKAYKVVIPANYVGGKLAGLKGDQAYFENTSTGYSGLIDYGTGTWDKEICDACGIDFDKLPEVVEPTRIVGTLSKAFASELGLKEGISIVSGAGDFPAGCLASCILEPGQWGDVAGTASMFTACSDYWKPDPSGMIRTLKSPIPGYWYAFCFTTGGGCVRWFIEDILASSGGDPKKISSFLNGEAAKVPAGSEGLAFYSSIGGAFKGEPIGGGYAGFRWSHKVGHMFRAILEAITFEYKEYDQALKALLDVKPREIRVSGGGSANDMWNQIKADTLNIPYKSMRELECSLLGSMIIAGKAIGVYDDMAETALSINAIEKEYQPNPERNAVYEKIFKSWHDLKDENYRMLQGLKF